MCVFNLLDANKESGPCYGNGKYHHHHHRVVDEEVAGEAGETVVVNYAPLIDMGSIITIDMLIAHDDEEVFDEDCEDDKRFCHDGEYEERIV